MTTDIVKAQPAPSLSDMVRYAEHLAHANLLPKQFINRPANVLYAMEYGRTLGITPIAAITGIHVIDGKPSASSGLIGGLVRQAGHKLRVSSDGATTATAQIIRADDPQFTYEATWTLTRAVQAGLCQIKDDRPFARDSKGHPTPWEKYPAAMLKARAITEVARDACEDVLFGLHYTPEELGVYVDQDGAPVDAPVQPLRSVETAPAPDVSAPAGRDYLAEARAATTAEQVREIYLAAGADPSAPPELARELAEIGRSKPAPASAGEPADAGVVPDSPEDEHARAVADLRAAAAAGIADVDTEFERSFGLPIDQAAITSVHEMTALLTGSAA